MQRASAAARCQLYNTATPTPYNCSRAASLQEVTIFTRTYSLTLVVTSFQACVFVLEVMSEEKNPSICLRCDSIAFTRAFISASDHLGALF